jgi:hypothetical protein
MLTSMLLNELQKQSRENERLSAQLVALKTSTGRALAAMQERMAALEQARQLKGRRRKAGRSLAAEQVKV